MLSPEKLKQNALTSIRLGVEDFERVRMPSDQRGEPKARVIVGAKLVRWRVVAL